jgi:hypothetical protein
MTSRQHYQASGGSEERLPEQSSREGYFKGRTKENAARNEYSKERKSGYSTKEDCKSSGSRTVVKKEHLERRGVETDNRKTKGIIVESDRRKEGESRVASKGETVSKGPETYGDYKRRKTEGKGGGGSKLGDSREPEAKKFHFWLPNKDDTENCQRGVGTSTSCTTKVNLRDSSTGFSTRGFFHRYSTYTYAKSLF